MADDFSVEAVVEMHDVDAFEDPVSAYPAITVIRRAEQESVLVASTTSSFGEADAEALRTWSDGDPAGPLESSSLSAAWLPGWFDGEESWPWGTPEQLALVADLERRLPPLEDIKTGTRIGIGLATGADGNTVFVDVRHRPFAVDFPGRILATHRPVFDRAALSSGAECLQDFEFFIADVVPLKQRGRLHRHETK